MAGELGFEPRSSVLETDSLTVELTPPVERLYPSKLRAKRPCLDGGILLGLFMSRVLAAGVAELRELQTARGRLLVLRGGVVPVLAIRALEGDDLAHCCLLLLTWPATSAGKQRIRASKKLRPTRRDAGVTVPATES